MLYIKNIKREVKTTEILSTSSMVNKYFWYSRSVYAVEFRENIYNDKEKEQWDEIILIKVEFEKNIILSKKIQFCEKHPICLSHGVEPDWVSELLHAYLEESSFDNRTKEQFDVDFNNVINNLTSLRKK